VAVVVAKPNMPPTIQKEAGISMPSRKAKTGSIAASISQATASLMSSFIEAKLQMLW
jgi:hypothetical protein